MKATPPEEIPVRSHPAKNPRNLSLNDNNQHNKTVDKNKTKRPVPQSDDKLVAENIRSPVDTELPVNRPVQQVRKLFEQGAKPIDNLNRTIGINVGDNAILHEPKFIAQVCELEANCKVINIGYTKDKRVVFVTFENESAAQKILSEKRIAFGNVALAVFQVGPATTPGNQPATPAPIKKEELVNDKPNQAHNSSILKQPEVSKEPETPIRAKTPESDHETSRNFSNRDSQEAFNRAAQIFNIKKSASVKLPRQVDQPNVATPKPPRPVVIPPSTPEPRNITPTKVVESKDNYRRYSSSNPSDRKPFFASTQLASPSASSNKLETQRPDRELFQKKQHISEMKNSKSASSLNTNENADWKQTLPQTKKDVTRSLTNLKSPDEEVPSDEMEEIYKRNLDDEIESREASRISVSEIKNRLLNKTNINLSGTEQEVNLNKSSEEINTSRRMQQVPEIQKQSKQEENKNEQEIMSPRRPSILKFNETVEVVHLPPYSEEPDPKANNQPEVEVESKLSSMERNYLSLQQELMKQKQECEQLRKEIFNFKEENMRRKELDEIEKKWNESELHRKKLEVELQTTRLELEQMRLENIRTSRIKEQNEPRIDAPKSARQYEVEHDLITETDRSFLESLLVTNFDRNLSENGENFCFFVIDSSKRFQLKHINQVVKRFTNATPHFSQSIYDDKRWRTWSLVVKTKDLGMFMLFMNFN